jgi:hypothetical protein
VEAGIEDHIQLQEAAVHRVTVHLHHQVRVAGVQALEVHQAVAVQVPAVVPVLALDQVEVHVIAAEEEDNF